MNNFIRVIGKDIRYTNADVFMYINIGHIVSVYPQFAVLSKNKDSGEEIHWMCLPTTPDAKLFLYILEDINGVQYNCGLEEIKKLGIENAISNSRIGFIQGEGENKVPFDNSAE